MKKLIELPWTTCGRVAEAFCGPHGIAEVERPPVRLYAELKKLNEAKPIE
jgi:hypothetical protein